MKNLFSKYQLKFLIGIGVTLGLRQMALILIAPFISIYGRQLSGQTPALIGLSLGIYGLTQAILQTPYGSWSDNFGRKKLVLIGLAQLLAGFLLAAVAKDIFLFILARALQGSGAVSAVIFSWIGDRIDAHKRDRAMSLIAIFIGGDAILGLVGGPFLMGFMSMPQIFLLCALLVLISGLYILFFLREDYVKSPRQSTFSDLLTLMKNKTLLKMAIAGFSTNYIMLGSFFMIPLLLEKSLPPSQFWKIFLPAIVLGLATLRLSTHHSDKGHLISTFSILFSIILGSTLLLLWQNVYATGLSLMLTIIAFVSLIAILPSNVTKLAKKRTRGKVTGYFNTIHTLGEFAGASLTGLLFGIHEKLPVIIFVALALISLYSLRRVNPAHFQGDTDSVFKE